MTYVMIHSPAGSGQHFQEEKCISVRTPQYENVNFLNTYSIHIQIMYHCQTLSIFGNREASSRVYLTIHNATNQLNCPVIRNRCLLSLYKIENSQNIKYLPKAHVNGQNFLHVVCGQFILYIWIVDIVNSHHTAQFLNLHLPVKYVSYLILQPLCSAM